MRTYRSLIFIILFLALPALACDLAGASVGDVLFQDDFSKPDGGWDRVYSDDAITDYAENGYRIQVNTADTDVWANPNISDLTDIRIEVDATRLGGPEDNLFGVICRYRDALNFYFLVISSDGYYGIGKVKDGQHVLITGELMLPSEAILTGNRNNHLRAECIGSTLSLSVNGLLLDTRQDADFPAGNVGLMAGTFSASGTDILFDNFKVLKP